MKNLNRYSLYKLKKPIIKRIEDGKYDITEYAVVISNKTNNTFEGICNVVFWNDGIVKKGIDTILVSELDSEVRQLEELEIKTLKLYLDREIESAKCLFK